jgi:hypothetical protein
MDSEVEALFRQYYLGIEDHGFSAAVMKRIRRRILLRRAVLASAVVSGLLLAIGPVSQLTWTIIAWLGNDAAARTPSELLGLWSVAMLAFLSVVAPLTMTALDR